MTSFVKSVAVLSAVCLAASALVAVARNDDSSTPKPDSKESGKKKDKKKKDGDQPKNADQSATPAPHKKIDVPVEKGHDSYGMHIPYFNGDGKREMNFTIGVASRLDEDHIHMKDLNIETFNEQSEHEMDIYMPTAVFNTATSWVTSQQHVTIKRDDFEISGEALAFNTQTKQGGLGGNVTMIIYNLEEETDSKVKADEAKKIEEAKDKAAGKDKPAAPATPVPTLALPSDSTSKPAANTPRTKAK